MDDLKGEGAGPLLVDKPDQAASGETIHADKKGMDHNSANSKSQDLFSLHHSKIEAPPSSKRKGTPVFVDEPEESSKQTISSTSSLDKSPTVQPTNQAVRSTRMSIIGPSPLIHNIDE